MQIFVTSRHFSHIVWKNCYHYKGRHNKSRNKKVARSKNVFGWRNFPSLFRLVRPDELLRPGQPARQRRQPAERDDGHKLRRHPPRNHSGQLGWTGGGVKVPFSRAPMTASLNTFFILLPLKKLFIPFLLDVC